MTPLYRSEALLAPVTEEQEGGMSRLAGQFGGIAAMAGIDIGAGGGTKEEAIALLKSRALTEEFIDDKDLLKVLFYEDWNEKKEKWNFADPRDIPTMWDAYEKFDEDIRSVVEDRDTGLVTLVIKWQDPKLAAEWASELIKRVNESMRQRAIIDAEKSLNYLKQELDKTSSVEVQEAIYRLVENQIKKIMLANVREEYSFKIIDPPVAPDIDAEVEPNKKLIVILGFVFGFIGAVFIAFVKNYIAKVRVNV